MIKVCYIIGLTYQGETPLVYQYALYKTLKNISVTPVFSGVGTNWSGGIKKE
jgi:hypothetical protein